MNNDERIVIERLGCDPEELKIDIDLDVEIDLDFDPEEKLMLRLLADLHRKVGRLMADLSQLNAAVDALTAADADAANELAALRDEISQLTAGEITQEQIDSLTNRVTEATSKLAEAVNAPDGGVGGTGGEEPAPEAPPADQPPAGEPPAEEPAPSEPEAPVGEEAPQNDPEAAADTPEGAPAPGEEPPAV